jgi:DNA-binding MarR family transcriptional regulator
MDKLSDKVLGEKLKISFTQFKVLMAIGDKTVCQKEVAEYWDTTEAAVSRQIENMVAEKLLTRKENKENRRQNLLVLTEKGQKMLEKGYSVLDDANDKLFDNLSQTERTVLVEGLRKLLNQICTGKTKDPFISCS